HTAGDAPEVARPEDPGDAPDRELQPAFQQDAHLLMGVGVVGDNRAGLEVDDRQHDPASGSRPDLDAWEDLMPRPGPGGVEVAVRVGEGAGLFTRRGIDHWTFP